MPRRKRKPADLATQLAEWADRLRDIAAMGLHFADNPYDRANYRVIQRIAVEMLALATGNLPKQIATICAPLFSRPTPLAGGDAAVIDRSGRILLVRRVDNRAWAMPGGALEVGETPAEGVEREALEETGIRCRAEALVGVFDSRLCGTVSPHHMYQFVFLCQPLTQVVGPPSHAQEIVALGWFAEDALPEPLDPGHATRIPEAFRVWRHSGAAYFDK